MAAGYRMLGFASITLLAVAACGGSSDSSTQELEERIATLERSLADAEEALDAAAVHDTAPSTVVSTVATSPPPPPTADTTTSPTTTALPYVLPAGGELTERQAEMVTVVGQYIEAIRANDGDGAAAFMTQDAYLEYPELDGMFRVSDGTLQERFRTFPEYSALHPFEPMMVAGDRVIISGKVDTSEDGWLSIIKFTSDGPVLVMSESVYV